MIIPIVTLTLLSDLWWNYGELHDNTEGDLILIEFCISIRLHWCDIGWRWCTNSFTQTDSRSHTFIFQGFVNVISFLHWIVIFIDIVRYVMFLRGFHVFSADYLEFSGGFVLGCLNSWEKLFSSLCLCSVNIWMIVAVLRVESDVTHAYDDGKVFSAHKVSIFREEWLFVVHWVIYGRSKMMKSQLGPSVTNIGA